MSTQQNIPKEEIDLGSLFSSIGKGFSNLFNSIGNFIKTIFHYILVLLIFIKKNIIIIGATTVIGVLIGFFQQKNTPPVYSSEMLIETNYNSGNRLYRQLEYVNGLLADEDFDKVSELLNISNEQAAELISFEAEVFNLNKQVLADYDNFVQYKDSLFTKKFELGDFKDRKSQEDYRFHIVTAVGLKPTSFEKLNTSFVTLIENDYYKTLKERKLKEENLKKRIVLANINDLDSLQKRYNKVALLQANRGIKVHEVSVSTRSKEDQEHNFDLDIYDQFKKEFFELEKINVNIDKYEQIVRIKDGFKKGLIEKGISSKKWVTYGIYGFLLALLVLFGLRFNKYLGEYEKETA